MKPRDAQSLVHQIERAMVDGLSRPGPARILVAVSGGPDSSAALYALADRAAQHDWALEAVHVDHGLADRETRESFAQAVDRLAGRLGVDVHHAQVNVWQRSQERGESVETAARGARYEEIAALARRLGVNAVVTGHTIDDQAETVLLHLLRGSGLDGLAGMRVRGTFPLREAASCPPLLRPLLEIRREETRAFCALWGIDVVQDPSNDDLAFTRNRIRSQLLPALRRFNPAITRALADLASDAGRDRDLLAELSAQGLEATTERREPGAIELSRKSVASLPDAIAIRVLRLAVERVGGEPPSHERSLAIWRLAQRGGHRVELGGAVCAESRGDLLRIWSG